MNQQQYADLIKQAALSMGKKFVFNFVVSKIPILGNVVFGPVVGWVIGKVLEIAILKTEMGLFFIYIDLRTSQQGRDFQDAAFKNALAQKGTNEKLKKEYEKNLIDSFRAFVKFSM